MTKQIAKTVKKSEKTTSKKTIAARTTKKTIAEVGQEALQIIEAHEEGADMDAGFDAGEFSGPVHSRAEEKELEALAVKNGFTKIQLDAELSRLEHEHDDDQAPTAIITHTVDPDIKAAPKMIALAAKAAQKKPVAPIVHAEEQATVIAAGFAFARAEVVEGCLAAGYIHSDNRAVLVKDDGYWMLRHANGAEVNGQDAASLATALAAPPPKPLSKKKQRIADAGERGKIVVATIKTHSTQTPHTSPARVIEVVHEIEALAAEKKAAKIAAATPGMPPNVIRAVEMLSAATDGKFDVASLRGDKVYGTRLALLKKLFDREKVLVAETGVNNLTQAFYSALGAGGKSHAAQAADFAARCADLLAKHRAALLAAGKEAKKTVRAFRRQVKTQLTVPGEVLPNPKPLGRNKQREVDAADRKQLAATLAVTEQSAKPNPSVKGLIDVEARNLRVLNHKNGLISLKLERCNSQGALHIWADDSDVMHSGVLTPQLAVDVKPEKYDRNVITEWVNIWLMPKFKKTSEMEETLNIIKRAIQRATEPVTLSPITTIPIAAPRPGADVPRITPGCVKLLEDPTSGCIVLMQLEKENTQGAICVYNNGSRIGAGVVPPEVLRSLRPVPGEVDLIKAANQLLNPATPTVPVTPVAASHLTAVIHCKEIIMPATASVAVSSSRKFAAKPAASTSAKTTKTATTKAAPAKATVKTAKTATASTLRSSYAGKKIKVLTKEHGARQGTLRQKGMDIILKSKTTDEASPALAKIGANNTFIAFAVKQGFVELV